MKDIVLFSREQINRFETLDQWFHSPLGRHVMKAMTAELAPLKEQLMGERLIQLGSCANNGWLSGLQFKRKWLFTPIAHPDKHSCRTFINVLPIDRESIDCVVAPLTLDAFPFKDPIIDEIDRILKPMGHVIFMGINPLSLWGLWLKYSNANCFGSFKGCAHSDLSLKRTMLLRGYLQRYYNAFYFIPPVAHQQVLGALEFLNQIGKMIAPMPAAFYCLVLQKQVENPIGPIVVRTKKEFVKSSPAFQPVC